MAAIEREQGYIYDEAHFFDEAYFFIENKVMEVMKMKKRIFSLVLALVLCLSLAPVVTLAADTPQLLPTITIEIPDSKGLRLTLKNFAEQYYKNPSRASYIFYYSSNDGSAVSFNKDLFGVPIYKEGEKGVVGTSYSIGFPDKEDERQATIYASAGEVLSGEDTENRGFPSVLYIYPNSGSFEGYIEIQFNQISGTHGYDSRTDKLPVAQLAVSNPVPPGQTAPPSTQPSPTATAKPTASAVLINGTKVAFEAYNINDNNYFKLRDLAAALAGTEKQFDVGWDGAANAISLTSGQAYAAGIITGKAAGNKTATATTSKILIDGKEVAFTAYNIDDNNYFKLRDIGEAFDFRVDWDGAANTITLDTGLSYAAN
jgi:hypothetical protein